MKNDRIIIRGADVALIMQSTTIRVRWNNTRARFEAYFFVQETCGRSYGGEIITVGQSPDAVINKAQSVGAVRKMQVWW
jgi:hypothetical protein